MVQRDGQRERCGSGLGRGQSGWQSVPGDSDSEIESERGENETAMRGRMGRRWEVVRRAGWGKKRERVERERVERERERVRGLEVENGMEVFGHRQRQIIGRATSGQHGPWCTARVADSTRLPLLSSPHDCCCCYYH